MHKQEDDDQDNIKQAVVKTIIRQIVQRTTGVNGCCSPGLKKDLMEKLEELT